MLKISKDKHIYSMSGNNKHVLKAKPKDLIEFETYDCFQNQIKQENQSIDELDWNHINPATGPLYVENAEINDVLKVDIKKIEVNDYGVIVAIPGAGLLGNEVTHSEIKVTPIKNGEVIFNQNIKLPLDPMIGVIGVAPKNESVPCGTPDSHGGNMDNKKIKEGTTLYFPVFQKGALLAMGDLHGYMGDGEIMVSGIEVGGKVQVKVDVIKNTTIENPILEDKKNYYTIVSNEDLLTAIKIAVKDMQKLIMKKLNMSFNESGMLISATGNIEVCQVVDPKVTVRLSFPKKILGELFS